jgi:putative endonuclease
MSYFVYILYSSQLNQYYTGHSADLDDRLYRHVNSGSKSTKKASDWKIVYTEEFISKSDAYQREMEIKKQKSRKYIEWLLAK